MSRCVYPPAGSRGAGVDTRKIQVGETVGFSRPGGPKREGVVERITSQADGTYRQYSIRSDDDYPNIVTWTLVGKCAPAAAVDAAKAAVSMKLTSKGTRLPSDIEAKIGSYNTGLSGTLDEQLAQAKKNVGRGRSRRKTRAHRKTRKTRGRKV